MLNEIHKILRDPECKSNIKCAMLALVLVIGVLSFMAFSFGFLERSTIISSNHYKSILAAKELRIDTDLLNYHLIGHKHRYHDGAAIFEKEDNNVRRTNNSKRYN